jgi:hypothetical protein
MVMTNMRKKMIMTITTMTNMQKKMIMTITTMTNMQKKMIMTITTIMMDTKGITTVNLIHIYG